jgi:hypothetical protein
MCICVRARARDCRWPPVEIFSGCRCPEIPSLLSPFLSPCNDDPRWRSPAVRDSRDLAPTVNGCVNGERAILTERVVGRGHRE